VNKGLAIGVAIGIVIAAIAGAYAFFGVEQDGPSEGTTEVGLGDKAEVTVQSPSESEEFSEEEQAKMEIIDEPKVKALPGEAEEESSEGEEEELEIKDSADVEVEEPEDVTVTAKESVGFVEKVQP